MGHYASDGRFYAAIFRLLVDYFAALQLLTTDSGCECRLEKLRQLRSACSKAELVQTSPSFPARPGFFVIMILKQEFAGEML